jgi:arylesterase/paraoxonase
VAGALVALGVQTQGASAADVAATAPAADCRIVAGLRGAEDIATDPADGLVFVSATDRYAMRAQSAAQDGLYLLRLGADSDTLTKLDGQPADFHPHGISLFRGKGGRLTLMAVNHGHGGASAVILFDVRATGGRVSLSERRRVDGPPMVSPNDLAAVDQDRFYVSDDRTGKLLYFDGAGLQAVASGLKTPNGVAVSADGAHIYVAETTGRAVQAYRRDATTGALTAESRLALPSSPDNIDVAPDGALWIAGHPDVGAFMAYFRAPTAKPSPSQIFKVTMASGLPKSASLVYANPGDEIGAASVGAVMGRRLLIGTTLDAKILDCGLPTRGTG